MTDEPRKTREEVDFKYLNDLHAGAKQMGMSDADIVKVANTAGDIDPTAFKRYKDQYK